ncbi:MAG TPA: glycosyl hydrolase family 18 protein [Ktedonobacteraceae bacterium]|nr:glycosyl hydrolase family 18 protein [Ktedonobacteraceae bacterium]
MMRTMLRSGKVLGAACLGLVLSQCFTTVVSALPQVVPSGLNQAHSHRVIYYYQTLTDLSPVIKNLNPVTRKPYPTDINLGAFHLGPQSDGTLLHLNDHPPNDPVYNTPWKQLAKLQSMGVKLHMMVGGAGCCSFKSLFGDWKKLYPVLKQTLRNYHFNGVDLDIEESVALSDAQRLIDQLSSDFGSRFLITLAPVASDLKGGGGLSGFNYKDLYQAEGSKIAWFNTQFYSGFGSLASTSDYDSAISNGFPPDKVVAGMLGNLHDGGGYVEMNQVAKTVKQLARKYTNFGGVFSWEYFDTLPGGTSNPGQWSQLMIQAMGSTQTPSSGRIS